jgi:hypothetical protein
MTNAHLERILRESTTADLLTVLGERLAPTDLQSLMLEVYRRRAAQQDPAAVLAQYERNRFVRPSATSPLQLAEIDRLAWSIACPPFEPIELAPVCPLATNAAVATVDQNSTIATIRNTELVSDSTNVLALECAVRRRALGRTAGGLRERVRLCASHRLLRTQAPGGPGTLAHFRLFGLCTAGRDEGSFGFELEALAEHLRVYLGLLVALQTEGYALNGVRVGVTDLSGGANHDALQARVLAPLAEEFPRAALAFDPERSAGRNYYAGLCFQIFVSNGAGAEHMIVDGGCTTWTQQLLSNKKERLMISGIGTERVCAVFERHAA